MGIKTRKYVRNRDNYDPSQHNQFAVSDSEIPSDAPTNCACCNQALTPLRRLSPIIRGEHGEPLLWCTDADCLLSRRLAKTANWRMANLHKQGETLVIV